MVFARGRDGVPVEASRQSIKLEADELIIGGSVGPDVHTGHRIHHYHFYCSTPRRRERR